MPGVIPRMRPLPVLLTLALLLPAWAQTETQTRSLLWGERARSYRLHLPAKGLKPGEKAPLLVVLHGGGGNSHSVERQLGFSELADEQGFVVVYPNAVDRNWNDGRNDPPGVSDYDDVGFIGAVIDAVTAEFALDPARVFVTGPSNGGMMTHRVGLQLAGKVAAIAPVAGGLATPLAGMFAPAHPVSVLMIQNAADPWVPYGGGAVRVMGGRERGTILPTEETLALWVKANGCGAPASDALPDEKADGCRVLRTTYAPGRNGVEVVLLKIEGGGHTWPGGTPFLPEKLIGRTCLDFAATPYIWQFFSTHGRKAQ